MRHPLLLLIGCWVFGGSAMASTVPPQKGYYWYEDPPKTTDATAEERQPLPPPPSRKEMMKMHPKEIRVLLENYLEEAVWLQTPESVLAYYTIQDVARRKASGFTALTKLVMLENPTMNSASAYPTNQPGRTAALKVANDEQTNYLAQARGAYALAMFTAPKCPYCPAQRNILKYLQDQYGMEVTEVDIEQKPDMQARFNVEVTPMVILIERGSDRWMPIAVGVENAQSMAANTYRAIRLLRGEINPQQFLTPTHEQGGFFDPTF